MKKPAFTLSRTIKQRQALRFAARFYRLPFAQRMALARAEKAVSAAFSLA